MTSHRVAARLFGIFFLITFVAYGTGSGLIDSVLNVPEPLTNVQAHKTMIVIGAILMALVHTFYEHRAGGHHASDCPSL